MEEGHQWNAILNTCLDLLVEAPENLDSLSAVRLLYATIYNVSLFNSNVKMHIFKTGDLHEDQN